MQEINSPWSGLLIYVLKVFPSLLSDAVLVGSASGLVNCANFGGVVGNIARDDFYNSSSNVSGWRG